ncbi:MAG: NADH-quinone oxidoreductase subunit NuoH [Dehalococcoidia bacterium]|nr:NADH-quinone oxidoreductase subunit NuoH [Dehalococcoidia bacterium]
MSFFNQVFKGPQLAYYFKKISIAVFIFIVIVAGYFFSQLFFDLSKFSQFIFDFVLQRSNYNFAYFTSSIIGALGIISFVGLVLLVGSWVERRVIAKFQIRVGPNRVGPFGLLQPIADAIKLMQKEVLVPAIADKTLFLIPPVAIFLPAILAWGPIPWAPNMSYLNINVGILYVFAVSSLTVPIIFFAGWSSMNHYALLGSMRTVAMMVSYEIPISLSLLSVAIITGTLNFSEIVLWQSTNSIWLGLFMPFSLFTFFFASTAEINRTPNDIAEAESEIVAGYHIEYSGMKAGLFMAVELGNAVLLGALVTSLFLNGWFLFGIEKFVPPYIIFIGKTVAIYLLLIWLRATFPRFRLDQLMNFAWKTLIPVSIINFFVIAIEVTILNQFQSTGILIYIFALFNIFLFLGLIVVWSKIFSVDKFQPEKIQPKFAGEIGGLEAMKGVKSVD